MLNCTGDLNRSLILRWFRKKPYISATWNKVAGAPSVVAPSTARLFTGSPPPRAPISDSCSRLVCSLPGLDLFPRLRNKNLPSGKPLYQHQPHRTGFHSRTFGSYNSQDFSSRLRPPLSTVSGYRKRRVSRASPPAL